MPLFPHLYKGHNNKSTHLTKLLCRINELKELDQCLIHCNSYKALPIYGYTQEMQPCHQGALRRQQSWHLDGRVSGPQVLIHTHHSVLPPSDSHTHIQSHRCLKKRLPRAQKGKKRGAVLPGRGLAVRGTKVAQERLHGSEL